MKDDETTEGVADVGASGSDSAGSWRDHAVSRSLDPARARAEKRVQRFLDAAHDLMSSSPDKEFTVQEVVDRSGQSLRSFYQYFAGKHELLLALFEEAVGTTAAALEHVVRDIDDPLERIRAFTATYYRMCRPAPAASGSSEQQSQASVMAEFAQQLLTDHPQEAARAFKPLATQLHTLLDEAADAGSIRTGLDHRQITGVVLQAVMFNAFADTISSTPAHGDIDASVAGLWDLLLRGLSAD